MRPKPPRVNREDCSGTTHCAEIREPESPKHFFRILGERALDKSEPDDHRLPVKFLAKCAMYRFVGIPLKQ